MTWKSYAYQGYFIWRFQEKNILDSDWIFLECGDFFHLKYIPSTIGCIITSVFFSDFDFCSFLYKDFCDWIVPNGLFRIIFSLKDNWLCHINITYSYGLGCRVQMHLKSCRIFGYYYSFITFWKVNYYVGDKRAGSRWHFI